MPATQVRGSTQLISGSVTWDRMASGAIVPLASIIGNATLLLSSGTVAMAASLSLGGNTITNVAAPVNGTDAANRAYVDQKTGGIGGIHEVRTAAVANVNIASAPTTNDGVTLAANDLLLLTAQTTASQNGPWVWNSAAAALTRPTWWAAASTVSESQYFLIAEGTTYKDTKFWCTTTGTITVDTTATAFAQDGTGAVYTASTGLTLIGGAFSVNYGTTSTTAAAGNDTRITGALQTTALGAGVQTALAIAVGTAGSPVINGGVLGTPSSGTLTNATGLPIAGLTGLGTGVSTALGLAVNAGSGLAVLSSGVLAAGQFPALSGDVTTTAGALAATVNNTAGSGFAKYTNFVANETPAGSINSSNTTFTLANTPATVRGSASSVQIVQNGIELDAGAGNDFTISGTTITMLAAPQTGDKLRAFYMV